MADASGLDVHELERMALQARREPGISNRRRSTVGLNSTCSCVSPDCGYRVIPQHEVGGYRIDLVVQGMNVEAWLSSVTAMSGTARTATTRMPRASATSNDVAGSSGGSVKACSVSTRRRRLRTYGRHLNDVVSSRQQQDDLGRKGVASSTGDVSDGARFCRCFRGSAMIKWLKAREN